MATSGSSATTRHELRQYYVFVIVVFGYAISETVLLGTEYIHENSYFVHRSHLSYPATCLTSPLLPRGE